MNRPLTILVALSLVIASAAFVQSAGAFGIGRLGAGIGALGRLGGKGTPAAPQPTGDILMVDGTSLILQTDGASFVCRAGGC